MTARASQRISAFVAALPLRPGMRVLEIGRGPGVAARLIVAEVDSAYVLTGPSTVPSAASTAAT